MITEVDNKSTLNRLNSDPSLAIISGSLKTTNMILKQKGYGIQLDVMPDQSRYGHRHVDHDHDPKQYERYEHH